jgi:hypothetical protein
MRGRYHGHVWKFYSTRPISTSVYRAKATCVVASPACLGFPSDGLRVSRTIFLTVCVWRVSSTPPCLSYVVVAAIVSVSHIARGPCLVAPPVG